MLDRSRSWSVFFLLLTIVCGSLSGRLYASKRSDQDKGLKHFYIVNQAVSDQPALQFSHILDVRIEEATTAVRAFRVAPHNEFCAKPVTIKAAERQLPSNTVAKLVAQAKLCSMTDEEWARVRSIVANARGPAVQDSARAAIVAECPSGTRSIILPTVEDTLLNQPLQSDSMRDFDILIAVQNLSSQSARGFGTSVPD